MRTVLGPHAAGLCAALALGPYDPRTWSRPSLGCGLVRLTDAANWIVGGTVRIDGALARVAELRRQMERDWLTFVEALP